jgi:hypothetical protein
MNIDQIYEQAKAIRHDIDSVVREEYICLGEKGVKIRAFTANDDSFVAATPDALLADILASTGMVAA